MSKKKTIVRFLRGDGMYNAGDVAGVRPDVAWNLIEVAKRAVYVSGDQPERDTSQAAEPVKAAAQPPSLAQPDMKPAQARAPETHAGSAAKREPDDGIAIPEGADVDVPSNWQDEHHATRRGIASRITGEEVNDTKVADEIIAKYLEQKGKG